MARTVITTDAPHRISIATERVTHKLERRFAGWWLEYETGAIIWIATPKLNIPEVLKRGLAHAIKREAERARPAKLAV